MTRRKKPFSLYLTLLPNWTWTQTYFLRTSRIFRLTPDWAHVFTGFGQSLPRTLMFSCFARYSSTSENKQEKHFFFFLGHSHFIRNCKEQISQFWQNRDFSRGWAKQLSLPNHYNTSLETLINWKWGEFYRNDSPIKQTNKMTNHYHTFLGHFCKLRNFDVKILSEWRIIHFIMINGL